MYKANKTLLRTKLRLDKLFIAKFLFSIDDRINKWLNECSRQKIVEDTSIDLVDFATIISDLKLKQYYCDLPHTIRSVARNDDKSNEVLLPQEKKRKISGDTNKTPKKTMKDESMDPEWQLKSNESWQNWRHKVGTAPTLSCNAKPCLKFHVKGSCFEDCTNRTSHRKLTGEDHQKTNDFINKIRRESK